MDPVSPSVIRNCGVAPFGKPRSSTTSRLPDAAEATPGPTRAIPRGVGAIGVQTSMRGAKGETLERGRLQLQAMLNRSLRTAVPDLATEFQTRLTPIREIYAGKIRLRLLLVAAAAGLLLLGACATVANLYLGRVVTRSQEFAVRVALGARRSRILGQMLTESTCLALIGGGLAVAFAYLGAGALLAQGPPEMRALADTRPQVPVLVASILASVATGLMRGVLPAWICGPLGGPRSCA